MSSNVSRFLGWHCTVRRSFPFYDTNLFINYFLSVLTHRFLFYFGFLYDEYMKILCTILHFFISVKLCQNKTFFNTSLEIRALGSASMCTIICTSIFTYMYVHSEQEIKWICAGLWLCRAFPTPRCKKYDF